ncbi:hypothetical protein C2S53_007223 [Perilla frutescens var. hirtella]|uniref:Receptor-like serine/threonine-protein kinase n=1 Tax=Perilla frutescens var. hirtella TaxID=608512 RepID=A0AAD4JEK0_PERFH|nr:hypothetical protein C2S53_007223 [Perilla frutescens var. hirtella]
MGSSTSSSLRPPLLFSFFIFCALFFSPAFAGPVSVSSIPINFTASNLQFIDHSGAFLASANGSFQARITTSKPESRTFYFVVIHVSSHTIIWSANRNNPISESSQLRLTANGLTLYNDSGKPIWSTHLNRSSVSSMQLLESGNLVLIDAGKNILWQSFDSPTDVLVSGQKLLAGKSLVASSSDGDLSEGRYKLVIGDDDAMLEWNGMVYWKLSMDSDAFRDTNSPVEFLTANATGVFLMGGNGKEVVIKRILNVNSSNSADFMVAKLDYTGLFNVLSFNSVDGINSKQEFEGPDDKCSIPMICSRLSVCSNGGSCSCAPGFRNDPKINNGDCVATDASLTLAASCESDDDVSISSSPSSNDTNFDFKYFRLKEGLDYFSNDFTEPQIHGVDDSLCKNLCSRNCSCLGVFYTQSSGSCYMITNYLGSMKSGSENRVGYIKMVAVGDQGHVVEKGSDFPTIAAILLPLIGVLVIAGVAVMYLKRKQRRRHSEKRARSKLDFDEDIDDLVSIPGLPVRLDYKEVAEATEGFKNRIGSGGFGTVYKGTLSDGSEVAVKKITCLGAQGKKEFLTEIAVIGKIHHVNLVKLKGFCAHGGERFLVYEFMKRGSLDRTLFQGEPVLDWKERVEIAVGAARGLAYLHSGCERKIIHCDVKPENILLHDKSQVKISDFGMSKLLSPEESGHFTTMRGTRGYLAPEWLTSSAVSDKTDVYSYGMVLLEIIRGRKNSGDSPYSGESPGPHRLIYFPLFALEMHEAGRYDELVDPGLVGRVSSRDVEKMVRVALCCVHEEPCLRPSMSNVVGMLEGAVPLGEPRVESLNFLRFYGRRFTEVSTVGENSEPNEFMLYRQPTANTSSTASYNSFSYISSQQVSGPR